MNQESKHKTTIEINQLNEQEFKWFAVYTKFKCEKYVATQLEKKKIEAYVPLISKTKRYNRKVKHYEVPLINCYVFVKINKPQYMTTLETEYVMKFLRQGKDLLSIPDHEIDLLKRVVGDIEELFPMHEHVWECGEKVEITTGHLAGMQGKIVSRSGKKSFVVELETIGYQLRINVDPSILRSTENYKLIA